MPPEDPRSDAELVRAANAGEDGAFAALYVRYRDWVVALAFRLSGSREDAFDIAQEVFLWLLHSFPGFELRAKMKTVLYPAVRNAAITRGRKRRREPPLDAAAPLAAKHISASSSDSERTEALQALGDVLAQLPPIHREVLILRFGDDLSLEEISMAMGLPLGTVKSRLHHALHSLRENPRTRKLYFE